MHICDACDDCGGSMVGDGVSTVNHCEFIEDIIGMCLEPDAGPIYCGFKDTE